MRAVRIAVLMLGGASVLIGACQGPGPRGNVTSGPQLFEGLGTYHRPVTTSSPQAQRYFDQGLVLTMAFNHDEAIRSFEEAARLDPGCAAAWWGIALCSGPHINNPEMSAAQSRAAWTALQKAVALSGQASPTERALIQALTARYADPPPADRRPLDEAYARAMRDVWLAHRKDPDIGTLYAEAMMNLRPWDLWTLDGRPQPGTEEIVAVLEEVLRMVPDHPGACHLYIHAVEASPRPERALAAADRLRDRVPGAGHLVHMPSHIYARTGRWAAASTANEKAIAADQRYQAASPRQEFYRVYMAHNHHFLAFASMMEGRRAAGLRAAREMIAGIPPEYIQANPALVDPYLCIKLDVLKRFGRWDELLREPAPPEYLPITTAMWHFSRGIAYAVKKQFDPAEREQAAFRAAVARVPADAMFQVNRAHDVLAIADYVLVGEIAFMRGQTEAAVAALEAGIEIEDRLRYMEPPEWIQPVRHTLGAVLLEAGRHADAERVYREDLRRWPENGWSLHGLSRCLRARGANDQAAAVERRFRDAWARADVSISASCACAERR